MVACLPWRSEGLATLVHVLVSLLSRQLAMPFLQMLWETVLQVYSLWKEMESGHSLGSLERQAQPRTVSEDGIQQVKPWMITFARER